MRSSLPRHLATIICAAFLVSCGGGTTNPPADTRTMSKFAGDNQSATVGIAVATRPAVKIIDQNNAGVAGITVTFAVATGGGSVTTASVATGNDGVATVGSWTLGASAGANTLTATSTGVTGSPVTFTATGTQTPPATITKFSGDNQSVVAGTNVLAPLTVKVVDASGAGVPGIVVTFAVASGGGSIAGGGTATTSGTAGLANSPVWTLGPVAGINTVTATVAGAGITGNPVTFTATGTAAAFNPSGNVSLTGTQSFGSVNIPPGVTVTLTGDATINVSGPVTIFGSIIGDCRNLTITATGALTSTGNINNSCSVVPGAAIPAITIVATGGYNYSGGTITSSGNINLTNDASLNDVTFTAPPAPGGLRSGGSLKQVGVCFAGPLALVASPATATAGTNGQVGTKGADASTWVLQCTGELDIVGGLSVTGQNGGPGGTGTDASTTAASATGGQGGLGGIIKVRANNGDLVINGTGNVVRSGSGGAGGAATATGTNGANPAASASATGGAGNSPGNIVLQAKGGGISIGSVTLTMGTGGVGGAGTATGALALDALPCPAGVGGAATAVGGAGGNTPDKTLTATGAVSGVGSVTVNGGAAGVGGAAIANGGGGGAGAQTCKTGGAGGAQSATGGKGGDALIKNALAALIAAGATGGSMEDAAGNGGAGWSDCRTVLEAGGAGGAGGASGGRNGAPGTGLGGLGTPGFSTFRAVANGGNGGDGSGPGAGGVAGASTATVSGAGITIPTSFTAGLPGAVCHPILKLKFTSIPNSGGAVAPGTRTVILQDATTSADVGTMTYTTVGNTFMSTSNTPQPRVGKDAAGIISLVTGTAQVNGRPWIVDKVNVCTVNASGISASPPASSLMGQFMVPVVAQRKNQAGQNTTSQNITSEGCVDVSMGLLAYALDLAFGPGFSDFYFSFYGHYPD